MRTFKMFVRSNTFPIAGILILAVMFPLSRSNYLLYHSIAELFSVIIAAGIFMVAWHTKYAAVNSFFLFIGIAYLHVGLIDTVHMVSYQGMGVFPSYTANLPTQLWIAARALQSVSLIIAPYYLGGRKIGALGAMFGFSAVTGVLLLSVFTGVFPDCFIPGQGLTAFKKSMEYAVSTVFLAGIFILKRKRHLMDPHMWVLTAWAIGLTVLSEMAFTLYADVFGFFNFLGHVLKIISFYLLYRAVIVTGLEKPYDTLFRTLTENEQELRDARDTLEFRVHERTRELDAANEGLRREVQTRREREEHLRETEHRFQLVLRNSSIIVAHCDRNLRYTWILNPNTDFHQKEMIGKTDLELDDNEGTRALTTLKKEVIDTGKGVHSRVTFPVSGGSITYEITAEPLFDDHGAVYGATTSALDITQQRMSEEALESRHRVLEAIFAIVTKGGTAESVYDRMVQKIATILDVPFVTIGRIEGDAVKSVAQLRLGNFTQKDWSHVETCPCGQAIALKEPVQLSGNLQSQFPNILCSHSEDIQTYLGVPVPDTKGNTIGMVCMLDGERRTFSQEHVQMVQIFARYVGIEFEREITQRELMQAREMQILGQLTSGVAHEVRNPLNGIVAIVDALFSELDDNPDFEQYEKHIQSQVQRMTRLMQDLLDFGRPSKIAADSTVSLSKLSGETVELWNRSNPKPGVQARVELPALDNRAMIRGDAAKLQQVLMNLLDNAAQHTDGNSNEIVVRILDHSVEKEIQVVDRGTGIPEKSLSRLFDPFYTTRKKGTGLGLPIVKSIVETHEGRIKVRNNDPEPGATVFIRFPAVSGGHSGSTAN